MSKSSITVEVLTARRGRRGSVTRVTDVVVSIEGAARRVVVLVSVTVVVDGPPDIQAGALTVSSPPRWARASPLVAAKAAAAIAA